MNKLCVLATIFVVFASFAVDLGASQCTVTCLHAGILDTKTCTCTCSKLFKGTLCETPNFTCNTLVAEDPSECDEVPCTSNIVEAYCPKKCYCERPSVLTNNCPPCMNGGILDTNTCKCTCKNKFLGPRCQFSPNPCAEEDTEECSQIDCWSASEFNFFKCQKKCLCCGNKKCKNLGLLVFEKDFPSVNSCKCECRSDQFDADKDCQPKDQCKDEFPNCLTQFGMENCGDSFVKSICPEMCGCK